MPDNDVLEEMVRRISKLENSVAELSRNKKLFEILNPRDVVSITAGQSNYDPGDSDMLFFLLPSGSQTIYGFQGGVKGRVLWVANRGAGSISFPHNSGTADAGNRILTASTATVTIAVREYAFFVYVTDTTAYANAPAWALFYPLA